MTDVDYRKLRSITTREMDRALAQDGFSAARQRGSHRRYAHPDGRRVTVPSTRNGDTFAIGTLRSIIEKQARWSKQDLVRLRLLKQS